MKRLNGWSLGLGAPGMLLQMLAGTGFLGSYSGVLSFLGLALLLAGLSFYARLRGRSPWFAALGLFSLVGVIILAVLPRRCLVCGGAVGGHGRCTECQAPMKMRG